MRPRLHRVGRGPAMEQREGRHVRRLVPDLGAVVHRRHQSPAPGRHQPVGGLERHLPGGGPSRRHPGDLLLAHFGQRWGCGTQLVEDLAAESAEHPFSTASGPARPPTWPRSPRPPSSSPSWSDQGLHTRGTFEGFKKISSPRKWLDAHGGKKWVGLLRHEEPAAAAAGPPPTRGSRPPPSTRPGPVPDAAAGHPGKDIYRQPRPLVQARHDDSVNRGPHLIHTGGRFDSHLLIPRRAARIG